MSQLFFWYQSFQMVVYDFTELITAHDAKCPVELKEHIGRVVERFAEQELSRTLYLNILVDVQARISQWMKRVHLTQPLWVESSGSFSSLLSHLDPIRRDLRHRIVSDLIATDVIRRHNGRTINYMQYNYNPFRFTCSSERERESLMRDLHHELTSLLPAFDDYIPNTRVLERQILRNLRESKVLSDWDVDRISIGHVERDTEYALDPRVSRDYMLFSQQSTDDMRNVRIHERVAEISTPQHPLLSRETYENQGRDRIYSNVVLYVNAYLRRRSGRRERVVSSFDFTIFVLIVELPNSSRYPVISMQKTGVTRAIAPLDIRIKTLSPRQWFRYVLCVSPNPILAVVWYVLHEVFYTDDVAGTFEDRVRRLDARIPDNLTPQHIFEMLPPRQQEIVLKLQSTKRVSASQLIPVRCTVPQTQCLPGRREGGMVSTSSRYLQNGRWAIVTQDGAQWAPHAIATFYLTNLMARRTLDCIIASHMISKTGDFHVTYVSSDSLHDTFF
tara:strand:+ start:10787 stop:12292 length:1506 start_codon:yes stop_codon:yes gene_type:complete